MAGANRETALVVILFWEIPGGLEKLSGESDVWVWEGGAQEA